MTVSGFRGFSTEQYFDLDGDVVLVSGPNGTGKTSFFDALLWALTGSVGRIGQGDTLLNRFSDFGECRVELLLVGGDDRELRIVRRFSISESLAVEYEGQRYHGSSAEAVLLLAIWPYGRGSADPLESFGRAMTRSIYLEQDRVNEFVDTDDEQQRFEVVGEIVGAGRLGELSRQLESGRRAWTSATNKMEQEFEPVLRQRSQLTQRIQELSSVESAEETEEQFREWLVLVRNLIEVPDPEPGRRSVERLIEFALDRLSRPIRECEGKLSQLDRLRELLSNAPQPEGDVDGLRTEVQRLEQVHTEASKRLEELERQAADARRSAIAHAEEARSLGALAQLAMKHMSATCPVCGQSHERLETEKRLQDMVAQSGLSPQSIEDEGLVQAADEVQRAESQLARLRADQREAEVARRRMESWKDDVRGAALENGLKFTENVEGLFSTVEQAMIDLRTRAEGLRVQRAEGERIAAALARVAEAAEAVTLQDEIDSIEVRVREHDSIVELRRLAAEDARLLHEAVRDVSESLVADELERIEPLLQRIYATVDPHPAFRVVKFLTQMHRGRGRLWTSIEANASEETISIDEPRTVLSSSQLNVLAVAAFLALNLAAADPPLKLVALDDPLQSLDNVNLLGLSDLLRRLRGRRQIVLSTHDDRLASLLDRKLRPVGPGERTISITFAAWDTSGPIVQARDVPRDSPDLRLVSSL